MSKKVRVALQLSEERQVAVSTSPFLSLDLKILLWINLVSTKYCFIEISFQQNPISWNLVSTQSRFGEILFGQNLISAKSCFCKIFYFEGTLHSCSVKKVGPAMRMEQEDETLRICNAILKKTSDLFVFLADFSHLHPKERCKHYRPYSHCTPSFHRHNWPEIYFLGNYTTQ